MTAKKLNPEDLYQRCDPSQLHFETTADLKADTQFTGQPRAASALEFGVDIERTGYNIFALGDHGIGKRTLVNDLVGKKAAGEPVPRDTCYVYNFEQAENPRVLSLGPGRGKDLSQNMDHLIEEIPNALRAAFESDEYQNRRRIIREETGEKQQNAFQELQRKAREKDLGVVRTPVGIVFAPMRNGEVISTDEYNKLPEEEKKRVQEEVDDLQAEAQKIFQRIPAWEREIRDRLRELDRDVVRITVAPLFKTVRDKYEDSPDILNFLNAAEKDIIENVRLFRPEGGQPGPAFSEGSPEQSPPLPVPSGPRGEPLALHRYRVNVLVDHSQSKGAPVIFEDNPTYQNLVGRIEHLPVLGALLTDFTMIRPGAFHKANGGYLVLEAVKVLQIPFAWDGLKRVVKSRKIKMEPLERLYGFISTISIEPEPVDLDVKVVLIGPQWVYYLLLEYDPEFSKLFKIPADFNSSMDRTPDSIRAYADLIGAMVRREGLLPFDKSAVARVIEHSSRTVEDNEKLSLYLQREVELLCEADFFARKNGRNAVLAEDVQQAIDAWIYRSDRVRERVQEMIKRDTIYIDTTGSKAGQINGLSVVQLGDFAFGRPSRISARVRLGRGEVLDIEREVKMSGPIHSKGVLILSSFLGARYAPDTPLSLSASLVFEQSYGGIEGDSASSAELYTLLSAISEVPLKQSYAVTGSVNQHGQIQPIGGVNEKIEGFFDTCKARGLTGGQGVLIPASNVKNLMLRKDVIDAVRDGKFHIYALEMIDDGMEILSGIPAGIPDENGKYPENSFNGKIYSRLSEFAKKRRQLDKEEEEAETHEASESEEES